MGFDIGTLGMEAGGGILGLALGGINDARQINQQQKLTDMQVKAQKNLTDYNQAAAYDMWQKTSYQGQKEQMLKAGLNPALMYGMGGGGGQTASVTPGSASGGQAPQGGGEAAMGMQFGLQNQMIAAQIEVAKSQANKNNVEAAKAAGVDTEQTKASTENLTWQSKSLAQGIENQKAQEALTKADTYLKQLDGEIKANTIEDQEDQIIWNAKRAKTELANAENETYINQATKNDKIRTIHEQAIYSYLANTLLKSNINKTDIETQQIKNNIRNSAIQIAQGWEQLKQGDTRNMQEQQKIVLQKLMTDFQTKHPSVMQTIGGLVSQSENNITKGLEKMQQALH